MFLALAIFVSSLLISNAAEVMPPRPALYFNDYAKVVRPDVAQQLNQKLDNFERETSSQIVVAVFQKMQSDSAIEDYTQRIAQNWQVGQQGTNNGAVLFVFIQDRKMFIQVGYGLEGALPDATAKRIVEDEIKPFFKNGDYAGGLEAGVTAMLQAVKGEYKGSGRTAADRNGPGLPTKIFVVFVIFLFVLLTIFGNLAARGTILSGHRRGRYGPITWGGGGGWGGGRSGGFGGGGGGFSGGGGSFGGGGAGGSW